MSFISRIFIYQSVIFYCLYSLFSDYNKQSSDFKDSLFTFSKVLNVSLLDDFIGLYSEYILSTLLTIELLFSLFAIFGCKSFGFVNAIVVLIHGFIRYNPFYMKKNIKSNFDMYDYKTYFNYISYELLLIIGVSLSMIISSTSYDLINNEDFSKNKTLNNVNNNTRSTARSTSKDKPKRKMD